MRRSFLVLYDYGQGGVWAYLLADSAEQIQTRFPSFAFMIDHQTGWNVQNKTRYGLP